MKRLWLWGCLALILFVPVIVNAFGWGMYLYINVGSHDLVVGAAQGISHVAWANHLPCDLRFVETLLAAGPVHVFTEQNGDFRPYRFGVMTSSDYFGFEFSGLLLPLLITGLIVWRWKCFRTNQRMQLTRSELLHERFELKVQGRFSEAIPIQLQILEIAQQNGRIEDIANAWNMLSHFYQQDRQLIEAEDAARKAIVTYDSESKPKLETRATYEMKLATILADQHRFDDAVHYGKLALEHFSDFHDPPDDFFKSMTNLVAQMEKQCKK